MTLLDHAALERARHNAGLLPLDLARHMHASADTVAAILARGAPDENLTLADLRRMAAAVAIHPRELLADATTQPRYAETAIQLAALLHRDGATPITEVAATLNRTADEILDAVDAYNDPDASHGLKIMRWTNEIGLIADPALQTPNRPANDDASEATQVDRLLWQVIDRTLPTDLPQDTVTRLETMATQGLVTTHDDDWRPSDPVIETLDLIQWDTGELLEASREPATQAAPAD